MRLHLFFFAKSLLYCGFGSPFGYQISWRCENAEAQFATSSVKPQFYENIVVTDSR